MSAMVTGGTGFIGAALVRLLLERDDGDVVAFHRNPAKTTLNDLADRVCGVTVNWLQDGPPPAPGDVAFYLITGTSASGENDLGSDGQGTTRSNANPCP